LTVVVRGRDGAYDRPKFRTTPLGARPSCFLTFAACLIGFHLPLRIAPLLRLVIGYGPTGQHFSLRIAVFIACGTVFVTQSSSSQAPEYQDTVHYCL
jgi:hypothetical protein